MVRPTGIARLERTLDTLSRLKGIETVSQLARHTTFSPWTLDTLSRLKGIETSRSCFFDERVLYTLDTLSRLKGIETNASLNLASSISTLSLDTLSRLKGIETFDSS